MAAEIFHLDVEVCKAESLARAHFFDNAADTYVKVYLDNKQQRQQTSTKKHTLFPVWQETLRFRNVRLEQVLFLKVYAVKTVSRDRFLGIVTLPLRSYFDEDQVGIVRAFRKSLRPRASRADTVSGTLTFKLRFRNVRNDNGSAPLAGPVSRRLLSEPIPEGWQVRHDERGRLFFHHPESLRSQWEHPGLTTLAPPPPSRRGNQAHPQQHARPPVVANSALASPVAGPGTTPWQLADSLPSLWELRLTESGRPYFVNHATRLTYWEDPRSEAGARIIGHDAAPVDSASLDSAPAYARNFASKLATFRAGCTRSPEATKWEIRVRRRHVLEDSYRAIVDSPAANCKRPLFIRFEGEEALDYGGVAREWFSELSRAIFNPAYGLFEYSAMDNYTLQISPNSDVHSDHIKYFKFIGRVAAMAVFNAKYLEAFWVPAIYKRLLEAPVDLSDLANIDPERYQSLCWMRDNDITDILFERFCVTVDRFGETTTVELVEGGAEIEVTEENKLEFIARYVEWRAVKRTEAQLNALVDGFHSVISREQLSIFDHKELELLIGGVAEIDVADWKKFTTYKTYADSSPTIGFFWRFVEEADQETRVRLLQFVTGTSRLPTTGFRDLWGSDGPRRFCIEQFGEPNSLPRAHTCFNRIDLPPYTSYELLKRKLTAALELNGNHFGIE